MSSYLAHTPTDIVDPLIATQTSVTVHGSSRAAIRQADTPDDRFRNPGGSPAELGDLRSCLAADVQQQSAATAPHGIDSTRQQAESGWHRAWSGWRRMRDSNSRGVAPNTLSKYAPEHSCQAGVVRDLGGLQLVGLGGRPRTQANETANETGADRED